MTATPVAVAPTARGREMRRRLIEAAGEVFAERGYRDTRVTDITTAAGTASGNFYRHFTNKNEILLAVLGDPLEDLLACASPPDGAPTKEQLTAWNTEYFVVYARHRRIYRVMREAAAAGEDAGFSELWVAQRARFVGRVKTWLDGLSRVGVELPEDTALMAEALVSMREQLSYVHLGLATRQPSAARVRQLGTAVGELWHRCLGSPAG